MRRRETKLELTWAGKERRTPVEPHVLVEDAALSYRARRRPRRGGGNGRRPLYGDNRLVHGDNLVALRALGLEFAGRIKCVYIDPPYNTNAGVTYYRDAVAHARWLSQMRDRLELLKQLLAPSGVIFVSVDDAEAAYLKVLMDEVFGRENFCGQLVWEKKKKPSFLDGNMGVVTEYILAYARRRELSPPFIGGTTTRGKKYPLNNAGNGVRVLRFPARSVSFNCADRVFEPQDMSEGSIITRLLDRVEVRGGTNLRGFRLEGEWRYSQATLDALVRAGAQLVISKAPFRPNHVRAGGEPKKLKNLLTLTHYQMSTYEDATEESRALFGEAQAFEYPKPEKLLATLLGAVTGEGDWVLDSFAGSGTTGAVAHKMRRRWVMIEQAEHCHTHIIPRLRKVIDGRDAGGVSPASGWTGGGGFRYFRLAPVRDKS
jgi:adenine-specific DNA-methyltransferase